MLVSRGMKTRCSGEASGIEAGVDVIIAYVKSIRQA